MPGPPARPTIGGAPVTVVIDRWDHPAYTDAALTAHNPAAGQITVHPAPAAGGPAALAQDVLYALGKRLPTRGEGHGTWADSLKPAWAAAAAWTVALGIDHVVVLRTHQLTCARIRQIIELRARTGIHLTLIWHAPLTGVLAEALKGIDHHVVEDLAAARAALSRAGEQAPPHEAASWPWLKQPAQASAHDDEAWIAPPPPAPGTVVPRLPRTSCDGADQAQPGSPDMRHQPETGDSGELGNTVTTRLHRIAHPAHAAALAATVVTGATLEQLALTRGMDIGHRAMAVKVHDGRAHRRCTLHPVPTWAQPLLHAAKHYQRLDERPPEAFLFPLITARGGTDFHTQAEAIRLRLPHQPNG